MTDQSPESRRKPLLLALAVVVGLALIGGVVLATGVFSGSSDDPVATSPEEQSTEPDDEAGSGTDEGADGTGDDGDTLSQQGGFVPEPMSGQEAVDELGERIGEAAEVNNMSAEQLENLLTSDPTVSIAPSGHIVYKDPGPSQDSGD